MIQALLLDFSSGEIEITEGKGKDFSFHWVTGDQALYEYLSAKYPPDTPIELARDYVDSEENVVTIEEMGKQLEGGLWGF